MEDVQQDNMKSCENCFKFFPEQKIDLHEAYCRRNIKKCPICHQMYDINDQEGHNKQFHSEKDCRYCSLSFPQKQWQVHQPSCRRRPVNCQFCENDFAYEEVLKHEEICGSRTTLCEICKKYIAIRQIDAHKPTCVPRISPIRNQPRQLSRDELRQNVRDLPANIIRIPTEERRQFQNRPYESRPYQNYRNNQLPSYEDPMRRNERGSSQRVNVISAEKMKVNGREKPKVNFEMKVKPSHIIEPERIRETVDPVPISIRLAMGKSNKKIPLQNRN